MNFLFTNVSSFPFPSTLKEGHRMKQPTFLGRIYDVLPLLLAPTTFLECVVHLFNSVSVLSPCLSRSSRNGVVCTQAHVFYHQPQSRSTWHIWNVFHNSALIWLDYLMFSNQNWSVILLVKKFYQVKKKCECMSFKSTITYTGSRWRKTHELYHGMGTHFFSKLNYIQGVQAKFDSFLSFLKGMYSEYLSPK